MCGSDSNQSQSFSYKLDAPERTHRTPSPATLPPLDSKTAFTSLRSQYNQNRMHGLPSNSKERTEVPLTKKSTVQLFHLELPGIYPTLIFSFSAEMNRNFNRNIFFHLALVLEKLDGTTTCLQRDCLPRS